MNKKVVIGSRESKLAVLQSQMVKDYIVCRHPQMDVEILTMKTTGDKILDRTLDKIGGKGLFVKELDRALLEGRSQLSVHSLKDMPMEVPEKLPILAFSKREDVRDVLVLPKGCDVLDPLKPIGCSSLRRKLQLKEIYPDMQVKSIRGNLQTRLEKLDSGEYSALVLAAAGLKRLGLENRISRYFDTEEMVPAAGQGILAVQGRKGLDYEYLENFGIQEVPHKKYLNDFLTGKYPDSFARGELYNDDPRLGDARLCGTTASLCGIERFGFEGNQEGVDKAVRYDITLHAFMLSQSGIPVIYSGDEIGQVNDYTYKDDPEKAADSRYLHRGNFDWKLAENRHDPATVQGKLFPALDKLEHIRTSHSVFNSNVPFHTIDTWDNSILAFVRENDEEKFIGIYNFSENDKVAWINEEDGMYTDLISGRELEAKGVQIPAFGCYWLCRSKK